MITNNFFREYDQHEEQLKSHQHFKETIEKLPKQKSLRALLGIRSKTPSQKSPNESNARNSIKKVEERELQARGGGEGQQNKVVIQYNQEQNHNSFQSNVSGSILKLKSKKSEEQSDKKITNWLESYFQGSRKQSEGFFEESILKRTGVYQQKIQEIGLQRSPLESNQEKHIIPNENNHQIRNNKSLLIGQLITKTEEAERKGYQKREEEEEQFKEIINQCEFLAAHSEKKKQSSLESKSFQKILRSTSELGTPVNKKRMLLLNDSSKYLSPKPASNYSSNNSTLQNNFFATHQMSNNTSSHLKETQESVKTSSPKFKFSPTKIVFNKGFKEAKNFKEDKKINENKPSPLEEIKFSITFKPQRPATTVYSIGLSQLFGGYQPFSTRSQVDLKKELTNRQRQNESNFKLSEMLSKSQKIIKPPNQEDKNANQPHTEDKNINNRLIDIAETFEELNEFQILSLIGKGSYGTVRKARLKESGEIFAIKSYNSSKMQGIYRRNNLRREIEILSCLRHQNIIFISKVVSSKDRIHLILEYAQGMSLRQLMKKRANKYSFKQQQMKMQKEREDKYANQKEVSPIKIQVSKDKPSILKEVLTPKSKREKEPATPSTKRDKISINEYQSSSSKWTFTESQSKKIFIQLVRAIEHIHFKEIAHRDIKLDNIVVEDNDSLKLKLIDFGFAIRVHNLSKISGICGTPIYMAPEIAKQKEYSPIQSDIWSLGVILFTLICAKFPFKGKDDNDLFKKIQGGEYRISSNASQSAASLINKLLRQNPNERPTAKEILNDKWLIDN